MAIGLKPLGKIQPGLRFAARKDKAKHHAADLEDAAEKAYAKFDHARGVNGIPFVSLLFLTPMMAFGSLMTRLGGTLSGNVKPAELIGLLLLAVFGTMLPFTQRAETQADSDYQAARALADQAGRELTLNAKA